MLTLYHHGSSVCAPKVRMVLMMALREREQAPPLSVLQIFRSVVDDP